MNAAALDSVIPQRAIPFTCDSVAQFRYYGMKLRQLVVCDLEMNVMLRSNRSSGCASAYRCRSANVVSILWEVYMRMNNVLDNILTG